MTTEVLPLTLKLLGPRSLITSAMPVEDALSRIEARFAKADPGEALDRLFTRIERVNILSLYQDIFPEDFARSTASCDPSGKPLSIWSPFGYPVAQVPGHSPREMEFFSLVNDRLFELPYDWIEMNESRLDQIMFWGPFNNWDEESEPDNMSPALQLAGAFITNAEWTTPERTLALLTGRIEPEYRHDWTEHDDLLDYSQEPPLLPVIIEDHLRAKHWGIWEQLVRRLDPPVCYIDDSVNMLSHNTGVYEIDFSCMCGSCGLEMDWTRENIDLLTEQHKRGQQIFRNQDELNIWIKSDPERNISEIVNLYNYAAYLAGAAALERVPREKQLSLFANSY